MALGTLGFVIDEFNQMEESLPKMRYSLLLLSAINLSFMLYTMFGDPGVPQQVYENIILGNLVDTK